MRAGGSAVQRPIMSNEPVWEVEDYEACDPVIAEDQNRKLRLHARRAKGIVDALLSKELVLLKPERDARARLEARLVRCLKNGVFSDGWAGERLVGVLVHCDAVEEVFADPDGARHALEHCT